VSLDLKAGEKMSRSPLKQINWTSVYASIKHANSIMHHGKLDSSVLLDKKLKRVKCQCVDIPSAPVLAMALKSESPSEGSKVTGSG